MSLLINGFLMTSCGGGSRSPARPAAEEHEPPIHVDPNEAPPPPDEEDPDYGKKGGPGAGGGYLVPPTEDTVSLSDAARSKK
ncbi:MAG: hypothetical protein AMXMBFR33_19610 [Candidatus Xenobia bacterium]